MNFKDFIQKIERPKKIFAAAIAVIFLFSAAAYFIKTPGSRYVFRFQSVDSGRANVEWRLLPRRKGSQKTALYVEELLLGPKTERARPVFSPGTRATFPEASVMPAPARSSTSPGSIRMLIFIPVFFSFPIPSAMDRPGPSLFVVRGLTGEAYRCPYSRS